MSIPQDPFILLSFINMKLRDGDYKNFTELCEDLEVSQSEIIKKLKDAGFEYNPTINQFR